MKRLACYLLTVGILVSFVLIAGCSDDDNKGTNSLTQGDPNDPQYQLVSGVVGEGLFSNDGAIIDLSMYLAGLIADKNGKHYPLKPQAPEQFDSLSYTYSYSNFWHIFSLLAIETMWNGVSYDSMIFTGVDSLRFHNPLGPVQYPDSTTNKLDARAHIAVHITTANTDLKNPDGADALISTDASYTIAGHPDTAFYISGTSADTLAAILIGDTLACEIGLTANQTATSLYLDQIALGAEGGCPRAGTLRIVSSLDMFCETDTDTLLDARGTWTIMFTFDDGMVTININNGVNYWNESWQCGPIITAKSGWPSILRRFTGPLR